MNRRNFSLVILVIAALAVLCFAGCSAQEVEQNEVLPSETYTALDGTWEDEGGRLLYLDSLANRYYLQLPSGRVGVGTYLPIENEPIVKFDGTNYLMTVEAEKITFSTMGTPGAESLSGAVFTPSGSRVKINSLSKLGGDWYAPNGALLALDTQAMTYEFARGDSTLSGEISDQFDGKGIYLSVNGEAVYFAVSKESDSVTLLGAPTLALSGTYTREAPAADLSAFSAWFGTWYLDGDPAGTKLLLNEDGTWSQADAAGAAVASGMVTPSEAGDSLLLKSEGDALAGSVILNEAGHLILDPDPATEGEIQTYQHSAEE